MKFIDNFGPLLILVIQRGVMINFVVLVFGLRIVKYRVQFNPWNKVPSRELLIAWVFLFFFFFPV